MIAPPRSRCRSAVPDAIPARSTGTDPVSEWEAGVPANPTPIDALLPKHEHREEAQQAKRIAGEQRNPRATRIIHEPRRIRGGQHHQDDPRQDRKSGFKRRIPEHVLKELLADEHGAHQSAEDNTAGRRRDPKNPSGGNVQIVERRARPVLPEEECDPRGEATAASPSARAPPSGVAARLIAITSVPTNSAESTPPRWSTGSRVSLTWLGTKTSAIVRATTTTGKVIRNTEPHQKCSSSQPDVGGPSKAIAPPIPDHSAIALVRAVPDHSAVISASVVGKAMPAATPPSKRAATSRSALGAKAASRQAGTDSSMPSRSIILRP